MLRISDLTYRIGGRRLLDAADASLAAGRRVGLVGRNGTGKTTLLRLIAGALDPDGGGIDVPSLWRVGMTSQEAPGGADNLIDTVLAADPELVRLNAEAETATDPHRIAEIHIRLGDKDAHTAEARAARILAGLGFSEDRQQRPCAELSGGLRMRVALAALLFSEPDLLLLDEPTNHLDLEATLWLEDYLRRYPGTVLLVSHDRGLLNRVAEAILHLENGKLTLYGGDYDSFERTRAMRLQLNEKLRERQEAQRAHIQAFVTRFRYKASKARQAQSRLKMLARMEPIPEDRGDDGITFDFPEPDPLPPPLYSLEGAAAGYNGKAVLQGLSLRLDPDDRIALLGANGNGKSTFIKLLAGRLTQMAGQVTKSRKLRIGYFAQHQAEELDLDATPVIELGRRRPRDLDVQLRSQLGRFGFSQQRADTKIANLSGGEKARLLFALMSSDRPHILLLDEPTNHLDVDSRQALVQAINSFPGAVVIVSHDPHVLSLIADRFWLVDGGRVRVFDGDMEDYRALLLARTRGGGNGANDTKNKRSPDADKGGDRKEQRRQAAERRQALAPLQKQLKEAESAVHRFEREKSKLTEAMADPALYQGDSDRLVELKKRLGQTEKHLQQAEDTWINLQEAWEEASAETQ
ncbi:MAG: ABC-F family ATP-binding cassette domain-containing protein [Rhodospirillales bacterium]|nr:ABC-F family ATP-binding cassette domain-containing protein [Rhodospirillales bacterium]